MKLPVPAVLATALFLSSAASAQAAVVDFTTMVLNGDGASATSSVLTLTPGANLADPDDAGSNIGYESSAYLDTPFLTTDGFTTSFTLTLTNTGFDPLADGITFILQNDPNGLNAVGGGGGVGADGLAFNIGVALRSWDNNQARIFTNGNIYANAGSRGNFNLGDQDDVVDVTISYLAGVFSFTAYNYATDVLISGSRNFNLASLGPSVYVGFTGATGLSHSLQEVSNWDFAILSGAGVGGVPEPATWAMMILGFGALGVAARRRRALAAA
ncbi:MAG: PEPxxWA-CTERM sorting domain-containing protein [Enhydrobacter sp.]|nr:PEPxxWA-CTERM sorting domain-containing protein [Enhydrobacter sp.]